MTLSLLKLQEATAVLKSGGLIAYPTETVYGLGVDATHPNAIKNIFKLKGRSSPMPISVLIHSEEQLLVYVKKILPPVYPLIQEFWPGPLTLVFEAKENIFSEELLAGTEKIGLRVSSDPFARKLCQEFGLPITSTSANPSGVSPARSAQEVQKYFPSSPLLKGIVDGGERVSLEVSTVLDVSAEPFKILRKGKITSAQIFKTI